MLVGTSAAILYLSVALASTLGSHWGGVFPATTLALTSLWYHGTRSQLSYWVDQGAILWYVWQCLVDGWARGWVPFGWVCFAIAYSNVVYHGGRRWSSLAFGEHSELWHISIYIVSSAICIWMYLLREAFF